MASEATTFMTMERIHLMSDDYTVFATVERWWQESIEIAEESGLDEDWDAAEALGNICDQLEGQI